MAYALPPSINVPPSATFLLPLCAMLLSIPVQAGAQAQDQTELSTVQVQGELDTGPNITVDKLLKVPGAGGDPMKALEALPGVIIDENDQGLPAVRGSSPESNLYLTDHMPVGYIFHNDGYSTYHNLLIEDFQLKAGAWDAEYNNALGAVLDTRLRDPYAEDIRTTLDVSFLRAGVLVEGAVTEDSAFYAAYRESLLQLYLDKMYDEDEDVGITQVPKNRDYQVKYHWRIDGTSNLKFMANGAKDTMGFKLGEKFDEAEKEPAIVGDFSLNGYYNTQGIQYDTVLAGGTSLLLVTSHKEEDIYFKIGQLFDIDATTDDYRVKAQLQTPLDNGDQIRYGVEYTRFLVAYDMEGLYNPCSDDVETCDPASLGASFTNRETLNIDRHYVFAAYDWLVTPNWEITTGLGSDQDDHLKHRTYEPRLNSRYHLTPSWTLTAALGKHYQFPRDFFAITRELGNPDLKQPSADHYVVGFEFNDIASNHGVSAKLETYYKNLHDIIISNPDYIDEDTTPSVDKFNNRAQGHAYGVEFLLNKNLTNKWYGWVSLAYSKTIRKNEMTGETFNYSYDRPWVLNVVASYKYNAYTTLGLKWRYQSGTLITPINGSDAIYRCGDEYKSADELDASCEAEPYVYDPIEGKMNSERLPAIHKLDLRLDYEPTKDRTYYVEVLNAYNRKNITDYDYSEDYKTREAVSSLGTLLSLGATFVF